MRTLPTNEKTPSSIPKLQYDVTVLRLGHRLVRDERISTHIGLVSRAFGARELVLTGADDHTVGSLNRVCRRWGTGFAARYEPNWRQMLKEWTGLIAHLTMYGEVLDDALMRLRDDFQEKKMNKLLVVVGAEKVPREIYDLANYNISVGSQPHSEVAALAVFLDRLFMGEELYTNFVKPRIRIIPSSMGKRVEDASES